MQSTSCTLHENLMKYEMWLFFVPISVWLSSVLFKSQFTTIDSLFFVCNSNFLWIYLVSFLFEMILLVKKNYIYKINSQFLLVWWMFLNLVMCWQSNLVGTQRAEWAFLVVAFSLQVTHRPQHKVNALKDAGLLLLSCRDTRSSVWLVLFCSCQLSSNLEQYQSPTQSLVTVQK